jgi:histidinol-phosphatase
MSPRLAFAIDTAFKAGRSTLRYFLAGVETQHKADQSPVTIADQEAEQLARSLIETQFPNEAIVGEEYGGTAEGNRWVIDPIDGTKSFVCGVPLYGTLLSYEENGRPILGVVYFPALDELIFAEAGSGAFWNGRPCRVSAQSDLQRATLSTGSHASLMKFGRMDGLIALAQQCQATRTWSDAYGHMLVATGRIEAMLDPIVNPWDISAVKIIVEEAGGTFTDFSGRPNPTHEAVSSNGLVHSRVLEAFAS